MSHSPCPHLPPTTNILNSQQRLRLIRSTRKLGAVLGTTPCLVENDTSVLLLPLGKTTPKSLKRQGSIFMHSQSSSLSVISTSPVSSHFSSPSASTVTLPQNVAPDLQSDDSLPMNPPGLSTTRLRRRPGNKTPQLYLRLNTVPVFPTDDRVALPLPPTPSTPSPLTPATPFLPDPAEVRRKRMAKLARHLGEKVPTELVFPSDSTTMHPVTSPTRKRSQSVHVIPTQLPTLPANRLPPVPSGQDWSGEWNRSNIKEVQKELRSLKPFHDQLQVKLATP